MIDRRQFIIDNTRVLPVPSVPEIRLYQADEVTPLWLMTEADMENAQLAPPYWAFAWSGGQALARYVLDHPEIVADQSVLDIACGSGLVGIAAMKAGAINVLANDIDPFCALSVALNCDLNQVDMEFSSGDFLTGDAPDVDVILAGDICYEKAMRDAMLTFFGRALAKGIAVYIGDPQRTYLPKNGLSRCADYEIMTNADIEDVAVKKASVWKVETAL